MPEMGMQGSQLAHDQVHETSLNPSPDHIPFQQKEPLDSPCCGNDTEVRPGYG